MLATISACFVANFCYNANHFVDRFQVTRSRFQQSKSIPRTDTTTQEHVRGNATVLPFVGIKWQWNDPTFAWTGTLRRIGICLK